MNLTFLLAISSAFIIGLGKGGLKGLGSLIVALMALAYGAKTSTGIMVPLLIAGDILAVSPFYAVDGGGGVNCCFFRQGFTRGRF